MNTERDDITNSLARYFPSAALVAAAALLGGCQVLTYEGPQGERLSRLCLGASTAIGSLSLELGTNGVRRVELRGYQSDGTQALSAVTEAAVRGAVQGAK